jgi:hypothetical protein
MYVFTVFITAFITKNRNISDACINFRRPHFFTNLPIFFFCLIQGAVNWFLAEELPQHSALGPLRPNIWQSQVRNSVQKTKIIKNSARSLQLVLRVIPSVRGAASSVLSDDNTTQVALRQLNKVESDFQTHIQELWGKISAIMDDFFAKHVHKYEVISFLFLDLYIFFEIDYFLFSKVKAPVPSATMKTVVKQVKKLSDSLQEVLQPAEHVTLISKIHTSFNQQMDRRIKALSKLIIIFIHFQEPKTKNNPMKT